MWTHINSQVCNIGLFSILLKNEVSILILTPMYDHVCKWVLSVESNHVSSFKWVIIVKI